MEVSYEGGAFHGWQSQKNAHSVQEAIEASLEKILRHPVPITGSGRTDTGVHATGQIAHFDLEKKIDLKQLTYQLNAVLSRTIAVRTIYEVKESAHARFDAISRSYEYHFHVQKDPFLEGRSHYFRQTLDLKRIEQACEVLLGTKDFESFSRVQTEVNHFRCELYKCQWLTTEKGYIMTIQANRFLRGMVRAIVGTLIEVGLSKLSLSDFALIVEQKDRRAAGAAAPAHGLYLTEVCYPEDIYLN